MSISNIFAINIEGFKLTLENIEPINCIVAKVFGGSLASIPANAFDKDIIRSSTYKPSPPSRSAGFIVEVDRDVRNRERPANATDITAVFN